MKDLIEPIGIGIALGVGAFLVSSTLAEAVGLLALAWGSVFAVRMVLAK